MKRYAALCLSLSLFVTACDNTRDCAEDQSETGEFGEVEEVEPITATAPEEPVFGIDARPVRVGFDGPEFDACGGYGEIEGLNPDGDNFLSVRAAPDVDAEELDRLSSGTGVSMCEQADGWIGIVYEASGASGAQCGTGSPVPSVRDYDGPCRSGWVSERFVKLVAG